MAKNKRSDYNSHTVDEEWDGVIEAREAYNERLYNDVGDEPLPDDWYEFDDYEEE